MSKWDKSEFQRIADAKFRDGKVLVRFEDSSRVAIKASELLPPGTQTASWEELEAGPYEIVVPVNGERFEIPWSTLRSRTDPSYSAHLAKMADERANVVGLRLRKLREARSLTAREVAARAGISAQSLSRIENGRHDVVFTTLSKILNAMGCTLVDLAEVRESRWNHADDQLSADVPVKSLDQLLATATHIGLSRDVVETRIAPLRSFGTEKLRITETAKRLCQLFTCSTDDLLRGNAALKLNPIGAFKLPKKQLSLKTKAYAVYAHQLCRWSLDAFPRPFRSISDVQFRDEFREQNELPTFEALLAFVWHKGIPVLPLADPGAFHGACWVVDDRPVIVLKQRTQYHARWLFDLAHEIGHVTRHLIESENEVLDLNEISPIGEDDPIEESANDFAHELLLQNRQEQLIAEIVSKTNGQIPGFKRAVIEVAAAHGVPVDLLANYLAYRLSLQNVSWWGTAQNLQSTQPDPLALARQVFRSNIDMSALRVEERGLLEQALSDPGIRES
jgi:transcriptional regulator with XRE-family HTH domain/Zn-dependent peptidase ImmA (M78 family)